jgi:hypothetical protein
VAPGTPLVPPRISHRQRLRLCRQRHRHRGSDRDAD